MKSSSIPTERRVNTVDLRAEFGTPGVRAVLDSIGLEPVEVRIRETASLLLGDRRALASRKARSTST